MSAHKRNMIMAMKMPNNNNKGIYRRFFRIVCLSLTLFSSVIVRVVNARSCFHAKNGANPTRVTPNSQYNKAPLAFAFGKSELWAVRALSAASTYFGFVAFVDRPRGMLMPESNKYLEIKPSTVPGAALGLFAKETLRKDTILGTYPGVVIPLNQNLDKLRAYPQCEGYIWRFSDNKFIIDPTNEVGECDDFCKGGNPSMFLSPLLFNSILSFIRVPTTLCRINEPPRGRDVNVVTNEDLNTRTVTFMLERDVYEGEEFFIDYGLSYDRSRYGG